MIRDLGTSLVTITDKAYMYILISKQGRIFICVYLQYIILGLLTFQLYSFSAKILHMYGRHPTAIYLTWQQVHMYLAFMVVRMFILLLPIQGTCVLVRH